MKFKRVMTKVVLNLEELYPYFSQLIYSFLNSEKIHDSKKWEAQVSISLAK